MSSQPENQDESRKDAIIDAAARIFAEKGFRGTSNREIAREADISSGLIYWYFRDKTELFQAVIRRLFPLRGLEIPSAPAGDIDLETLLEAVARQFLQIMTGPDVQRLIRLALSEILQFPDVWQRVGDMISERAIGPMSAQIDQRIEAGEIPTIDSRLAAQAFVGSLIGYVLRKYIFQSSDLLDTDDQQFINTVVQIYARGLRRGDVPTE